MENKTSFLIKDILNGNNSLKINLCQRKVKKMEDNLKLAATDDFNTGLTKKKHRSILENIKDIGHSCSRECISPGAVSSSKPCMALTKKNLDTKDITCRDFQKGTNDLSDVGTETNLLTRELNCDSLTPSADMPSDDVISMNHICYKDYQTFLSLASTGTEPAMPTECRDYQKMMFLQPHMSVQPHAMTSEQNTALPHFQRMVHHPHMVTKTRKRDKKVRRPRTNFTDEQLRQLESLFMKQKYLNVQERVELAERLGLNEIQIKTWYQNRR